MKIKGIKLIIFDLDGTLVDAYRAITRSFNYVMRRLGYPRQPAAVIRRAVGWGDVNLLKPFLKEKDLRKAVLIYRRRHKKDLTRDSRLLPGVKFVLTRLKKQGYKLAIASNRPTEFSRLLIRTVKLEEYFDYVLCADKLNQGKPHPDILKKIMQRLSVRPTLTLYVGDMTVDAQAGRRAKVKTIIVTTGSNTAKEVKKEGPDLVIGKIKDVLKVL